MDINKTEAASKYALNRKNNKMVGDYGERVAVHYLESKDFLIIRRNLRLKVGEIDILAFKDNVFYIFEVKTAKVYSSHGNSRGKRQIFPEENLNALKIRKLSRLREELFCRLDSLLADTALRSLLAEYEYEEGREPDVCVAGMAVYLLCDSPDYYSYGVPAGVCAENSASVGIGGISSIKVRLYPLL